jgi:hypothetical protein
LERFLGKLWRLSRARGKASYKVLSEKLAANLPLTKEAVANAQMSYGRLSLELMRIRKSMVPATGVRLVELLHEVEIHIDTVTGALDPALTGLTFVS